MAARSQSRGRPIEWDGYCWIYSDTGEPAARSHSRGWPTEWDGYRWIYSDTGEPVDRRRPCRRCGRKPTPEGYDACLGHIPGARGACCGHGVESPYVTFSDRTVNMGNAQETRKPIFAALSITSKCNLSCQMCDLSQPMRKKTGMACHYRREGKPLMPGQWRDVLDRLGVTAVHIMGTEPLLYRGFDRLLERIGADGRTVRLTTNGWLFGRHREAIADHVDEVSVSIHGLEVTHDRIVDREGSFRRNLEAVEWLEKRGKDFRIVFTVTPDNTRDMAAFYDRFGHFPLVFNHYNYVARESTLGMCEPVNVFHYDPRETETGELWRAIKHCRRATFLPDLKSMEEVETYYERPPRGFVRDGNCGVIRDMVAGKRYAITHNGDFIPPGRCIFNAEIGNALTGEPDRKGLEKILDYIGKYGFPPACQRLCCYPGRIL